MREFFSRRQFLQVAGALAAAPLISHGAGAAGNLPRAGKVASPILVLVHLFGGNDGLNTVIPCGDPAYKRLRPSLSLKSNDCLSLGSGLYLHPALGPLMPFWQRRQLAIILGVGHPSAEHSHFRSSDLWHTAGRLHGESGWLGRLKLERRVSVDPSLCRAFWGGESQGHLLVAREGYQSLHYGQTELPAPVLAELARLYESSPSPLRQAHRGLVELSCCDSAAGSVDRGAVSTLTTVGQLLRPQVVGPQVYHCSVGGYDTHADQLARHDKVLAELSQGLTNLWERVRQLGLQDRTTLVVYSEFGRRAAENSSGGTDHGTAGPLFVLGAKVRGGLWGQQPSLTQLNEEDLVYSCDFRAVYWQLIRHLFQQDPSTVMGGAFGELERTFLLP